MRTKLISLFLLVSLGSTAQHWVFLKDKCTQSADYYDAPLCASYLADLEELGVHILGQSRWLNAVYIANDELYKVQSLPWVAATRSIKPSHTVAYATQEEYAYGKSDWPLSMIGLDSLHRLGYTGKGVVMAVFDGGFTQMDSLLAFDSLWTKGQVLAHKDFTTFHPLTFDQSTHGMRVMGLIAGQQADSIYGASPDAAFLLARTEVGGSETHQEEFNWVAGMEWADSIGVDIIHSSLGYSEFDSLQGDYSYADMNGNSTIVTIAAELAASRGIFITNSAGNQGNDPWHYITAPCDGEHVLCVGAVDSFRQKPEFSSFGPSSDGRVKPDLMAMGTRNTILNPDGTLRTGSGTSFSGPIIAGAVACLMQAHPERSNEALFQALLLSCDRYQNPDSAYGHGIPDLIKADSILSHFVDVNEPSLLNIRVFPNPAQQQLQILCSPASSYEIRNQEGRIIQEGTLNNAYNFLNIQSIASGTYLLLIRNNKQLFHHTLIKQ